jgi:hypothetical protein
LAIPTAAVLVYIYQQTKYNRKYVSHFFSPPAKGKKNIIPIMSLSTDYFRLPFFEEC